MAEEFQTGICGGNWWNSPRNSLCSTGMSDIGSFGWATEAADVKPTRSCDQESNISVVSHDSSIVFQDVRKPQMADSAAGSGGVLIDSTLQMMNFGLSTPTTNWNQTLLRGRGRADESNFSSMLEEDMNSRLNYRQESGIDSSQIQKDWSPKSFSGGSENSSIDGFKQMNQDFNPGDCTATCQGFSTGFPIGSSSYGYPSNFVQSLFESDPQPQQSLCNNVNQSANNYCSVGNYGTSSNEILPSNWPKFSPFLRPTLPKQQPSSLHFSNNTPFWNASAAALSDIRARFFPSSGSQFHASTFEEKPTCTNLSSKANIEEVRDSLKKSGSEPAFKRPRIETPSPLPTFKVRKEKLGDRITALQQLVSPFGKTDTASVLHEAIEYIKFLHDQVSVLSTPYMKNGSGAPIQQQQASDKLKSPEGSKPDLKSRGLCLVPISSTFPVANETTADFWTPTFGGTFR